MQRIKRVSLKPIIDGSARADYSPVNQGWVITWHGRLCGVVNTRDEALSRVWQYAALENQGKR